MHWIQILLSILHGGSDLVIQNASKRSGYPPEAARQELRAARIMIWLGVFFILPGIALAAFGIWQIRTGLSSNNWPSVAGHITEIKTQRVPSSPDPGAYRTVVRYRYVVNSQTYDHSRVSFRGIPSKDHIRATYHTGDKVTVHHAPDDPSDAVLEPGMTAGGLLFYGLIGSVALILCICLLWAGIGKRRTVLGKLGLLKSKPETQAAAKPQQTPKGHK
jgi:hypothetical protein